MDLWQPSKRGANMTAVLVRAAKLISGIQGSKAPETWHFRGAGSGAGGKRAGSRRAEGRIRKNPVITM